MKRKSVPAWVLGIRLEEHRLPVCQDAGRKNGVDGESDHQEQETSFGQSMGDERPQLRQWVSRGAVVGLTGRVADLPLKRTVS